MSRIMKNLSYFYYNSNQSDLLVRVYSQYYVLSPLLLQITPCTPFSYHRSNMRLRNGMLDGHVLGLESVCISILN